MRYTLVGPIKPYVHRTHRGKYSDRADAYHASQNVIRWQLKQQMRDAGVDIIPKGVPLRLRIDVTVPSHLWRADATNFGKAVEDAMQSVVFENDRYVVDIRTTKRLGDAWRAVLEVEEL